MSHDGSPVNLNMLVHARFFCKTCDRRFWSEHELVKHILEVRGIPHRTAPYATEGGESSDENGR